MTCYTIGYEREDGDFAVLATLNNNNAHLDENTFEIITQAVQAILRSHIQQRIDYIERQDSPDYIYLDRKSTRLNSSH